VPGIRNQPGIGWLVLITSALIAAPRVAAARDAPQQKRPVTVADSIEIATLASPDYFLGGPAVGHVARFSPNGSRFVIVLRKANLARNTNDFSILLYRTASVFDSPNPRVLLTMSSSTNDDAIKNVKWLSDNRTILFLGQTLGGKSVVFSLDTPKGRLTKLTSTSRSVSNYDASDDGRIIVFTSVPSRERSGSNSARRSAREVVVQNQGLLDLVAGPCSDAPQRAQLFFQLAGKQPMSVPIGDQPREDYQTNPISISPDGHYALIDVYVREIPAAWLSYRNHELQKFVREKREGEASPLRRFVLLDTRTGSLSPLLDAPMKDFRPPIWSSDSSSVLLQGTYLPSDMGQAMTGEAGEEQEYDVEVTLPSKRLRIVCGRGSIKSVSRDQRLLRVSVDENVNSPPKIYTYSLKTGRKKLLLDLNPHLAQLDLGRVEVIRWKDAEGRESEGGLYLPPSYQSGRRYPLVIQTHGFTPDRFSMDGRFEWSSAFAARPLSAKGILVLQSPMFADSTVEEGPRELARYLGAINYLDQRGLVDKNRVGIVGFSRTVFEVAYALTHSQFRFAAASLIDGIDGGYFQYIAFGPRDNGFVNGADPFGKGLTLWLRRSPGFNLDKVTTPVRILALGPWSLISSWEWFSGLTILNRPVDFVYLPRAAHMVVRPEERLTAEQDLVDWFCFWLKGEESTDERRSDEYVRWRKLRELLDHEPDRGSEIQLPQ
jgi:dipeptidyl aminopeptidase/acylaminoacyl peptidase